MANQQHLAILKQGVEVWNQWRREHSDVQPDFSLANLRKTILTYADLHRTDLSGADLRGADLRGADLTEANLTEADLKQAELITTDLRSAYLDNANLSGATLYGADLSEAHLREAELYGADLSTAILNKTVLSEAKLMGACLRNATLRRADLGGADLTKADLRGANLTEVKLDPPPDLHGTSMFAAQREQLRKSGATALEEIELESTDSIFDPFMIEYAQYLKGKKEGGDLNITREYRSEVPYEVSGVGGASSNVTSEMPSNLPDPIVTLRALLELAKVGEEEFAEKKHTPEGGLKDFDHNVIWDEWEG